MKFDHDSAHTFITIQGSIQNEKQINSYTSVRPHSNGALLAHTIKRRQTHKLIIKTAIYSR